MFVPASSVPSILALASFATQPAVLGAAVPSPPVKPAGQVRAARCSEKIVVDGLLTEGVWAGAPPITALIQSDPTEGASPTEKTEVKVVFDDGALYVGARLHDTRPQAILSQLARRDRVVTADTFTVFLDPHLDRRSGVYFGVNAAGTQYDGTLMNDDWRDDSWDGVWESRVVRDTQGWAVEMRIPFSQLRFKDGAGTGWGINFERVIARNNERNLLVYTPRRGSGFVSRFPQLEALGAIRPPTRIELAPYASFRVDTPGDAGDPFRSGWGASPRVGADLKVGLGSHLTLDATVYPDFGQVEVDPAVVNLSDHEVYFPERRPFFIEGADVFQGFGAGARATSGASTGPAPPCCTAGASGGRRRGSCPTTTTRTSRRRPTSWAPPS